MNINIGKRECELKYLDFTFFERLRMLLLFWEKIDIRIKKCEINFNESKK